MIIFGGFNNTAYPHDLPSGPGFATGKKSCFRWMKNCFRKLMGVTLEEIEQEYGEEEDVETEDRRG
jgi:hypothetical protein